MEVQYEWCKPAEADAAVKKCPVLFLPLGTIEWHGLHNVLGLDALKAHTLCVRAARQGGGLVHPPVYGGVGGLEEPHTFIFDKEESLGSLYLRPWLEQYCREAVRAGFKAVIILTGHYGAGQQIALRETAVRMSRVLSIPVLGLPEYWLALDEGYTGDHAAFFETSLMMYLHPDTVDLDRLGDPPHQGVGGDDPKTKANAKDGERFCEAIIKRLAALAGAMPGWDAETLERFIAAEAAVVNRQLLLAGETIPEIWTAWRHMGNGVMDGYPEWLSTGQFERIAEAAAQL